MILGTIAIFIIILGLLIFVHELGHFAMAKRAGMKVEEFGFGFPPRIFGVKKGETVYSVNLIPLGGFVRILGEDGGSDDPRAFSNKGFWARFLVLIAGVGMNLLLAWFLLFVGFAFVGAPVAVDDDFDRSGTTKFAEPRIMVVAVQPDSPAEDAGFKAGDAVVNIDGEVFADINAMIAYTSEHAGEEIEYVLERGGEQIAFTVVPRENVAPGEGPVGFVPAEIANVTYPIHKALWLSFISFIERLWGILAAFGLIIKGLFTTGGVAQGLSGPVGIAVLTRDFARLGLVYVLQFTAVLSINLAILNAVPFPALDGGRVLFLLVEKIRGRKSVKWEQIANAIGFMLLIGLMVAVTFFDFNRYSEQFKNLFDRFL